MTAKALWTMAKVKAKLSELIERAGKEGPQTVTRHGKEAVVIVSAEEWKRKTRSKGTLSEFLASSPLRGSGIETERLKDRPRENY
jgi:prevent-host-death family protein